MGRVEIIERLAEGPSYALDVAIAQTFVPQIVVGRQRDDDSGADPHTYRCFTTKLDDAIWLAETLWPGTWWHIAKGKMTAAEPLYGAQLLFGAKEVIGEGESNANPAVALLIALFRALRSQDEEER